MKFINGIVFSTLLVLSTSIAAAEEGWVTILPGELGSVGARDDTQETQLNLLVNLGDLRGLDSDGPNHRSFGDGNCKKTRVLSIKPSKKIQDRVFTLALTAKVVGEELKIYAICQGGQGGQGGDAIINIVLLGNIE